MKLVLHAVVTTICLVLPSYSLADSCSSSVVNNQYDTPTGKRIRAANSALLRSAGMTKTLTTFGDPQKCWDLSPFHASKYNGVSRTLTDYHFTESQLCLLVADYGIGSFDPLSHKYCKHNSYILQLHDESPNVLRIYKYTPLDHREVNMEVVGDYNKNGKKSSNSSNKIDPSMTDPTQVPAQSTGEKSTTQAPTAPNIPNSTDQVGDIVKKGVGDLIKGIGK